MRALLAAAVPAPASARNLQGLRLSSDEFLHRAQLDARRYTIGEPAEMDQAKGAVLDPEARTDRGGRLRPGHHQPCVGRGDQYCGWRDCGHHLCRATDNRLGLGAGSGAPRGPMPSARPGIGSQLARVGSIAPDPVRTSPEQRQCSSRRPPAGRRWRCTAPARHTSSRTASGDEVDGSSRGGGGSGLTAAGRQRPGDVGPCHRVSPSTTAAVSTSPSALATPRDASCSGCTWARTVLTPCARSQATMTRAASRA